MNTPLAIDFVSDVICPWCFIGLIRLEDALAKAGAVDVDFTVHPFQLDPSTPAEGADLRERLQKKYGVDAASMFGRVEGIARESGIPLDFEKVRRSPNTLKAHVVIGAAKARKTQRALARAIFAAYFLEGRDVGDAAVLADVASGHGFTRDEVLALVADEGALAATKQEAAELSQQGISGVPFTILAKKFAVSGAQTVETFVSAIERSRSAT